MTEQISKRFNRSRLFGVFQMMAFASLWRPAHGLQMIGHACIGAEKARNDEVMEAARGLSKTADVSALIDRISELEAEVARLRACNDASLAAMRRAVLAMAHAAEDAPGLYGETYDILDAAIDAARKEAG